MDTGRSSDYNRLNERQLLFGLDPPVLAQFAE